MAIKKEKDKNLTKLSSLYRDMADIIDEMSDIASTTTETEEEEKELNARLETCMGKFLMKTIEAQKLQGSM